MEKANLLKSLFLQENKENVLDIIPKSIKIKAVTLPYFSKERVSFWSIDDRSQITNKLWDRVRPKQWINQLVKVLGNFYGFPQYLTPFKLTKFNKASKLSSPGPLDPFKLFHALIIKEKAVHWQFLEGKHCQLMLCLKQLRKLQFIAKPFPEGMLVYCRVFPSNMSWAVMTKSHPKFQPPGASCLKHG